MTLHSIPGRHGVSLAAPPSPKLADAIGLSRPAPKTADAAPGEAPAPRSHQAAPERMKPQTRATLAALAGLSHPIEAADLRQSLGDGATANVVTGQLQRLAVWGFAIGQRGAPGGRYLWQVTPDGRKFLASCKPVTEAQILQGVAVIAREPLPDHRWWLSDAPDRHDKPTTAHLLTRHLQAQGIRIHDTEAAAWLTDLSARRLIHHGQARRKGELVDCYWPLTQQKDTAR